MERKTVPEVVRVDNIAKAYGKRRVLTGVSFQVERGEILSIVGPNGSGKTTIMEILEGIRRADGGKFSVLGSSPGSREVRERIGVALQDADAFSNLRVEEFLRLHASFYRRCLSVQEVLETVGLSMIRKNYIRGLSGGERQKLNLATAMMNDPEILFLDEPAEGLDPRVRIELRELLLALRRRGTTILNTTHYMEDAQLISDRVAVLGRGKIVALGPPAELIAASGLPKRLEFVFREHPGPLLRLLEGIHTSVLEDHRRVIVSTPSLQEDLVRLLSLVRTAGLTVESLDVRSPTLEDVYLNLTEGLQ
ncbi:MAG: ABC transporter ATP-binding protein [Spirochaetales bacterium]|nr:ABC transporter ATP-binding protein [Spirochaetales bacterium]